MSALTLHTCAHNVGVTITELYVDQTRVVWDALAAAIGAQRQPLVFARRAIEELSSVLATCSTHDRRVARRMARRYGCRFTTLPGKPTRYLVVKG